MEKLIINPYENIDFTNYNTYKGNLHCHTTESDGTAKPHEMVDEYYNLNFDILAITDHDYYKDQTTWAGDKGWSFSELDASYEDRDPDILNMLAVEGNELSSNHHRNSLFNDLGLGGSDIENSFDEIVSRRGLGFFAHPSRYNETVAWYMSFYKPFYMLFAMEVFNDIGDIDVWDNILTEHMPLMPIIMGITNDDAHGLSAVGTRSNTFFMKNFNKGSLIQAMHRGEFYMTIHDDGNNPDKHDPITAPIITDISVNGETIEISGSNYTSVEWYSEGAQVATGNTTSVSGIDKYIRAKLIGNDGESYTQPFGIIEPHEGNIELITNFYSKKEIIGETLIDKKRYQGPYPPIKP